MTEVLKEKIQKEIAKLPGVKQVAIDSVDWGKIIESIGNQFGLIGDEVESLQVETCLVLTGMTAIEEFSINIEDQVGLSDDLSQKVAIEIFNRVFEPILNKIDPGQISPLKNEDSEDKNFVGLENSLRGEHTNYKKSLYEIGEKYKLPIDQIGEIDIATDNFLSGKINSSEYEKNINGIIGNQDKGTEIIEEINKSIIRPKREELEGEPKESDSKDNAGLDIPLPPYAKMEMKEDKIPVLNYKSEGVVNKRTSNDNYMDHGIEILDEDEPNTEKNTPKPVNIFADKLSKQTISNKTVTDYSIPKINTKINPISEFKGGDQEKPHDPYREEV